MALSNFNLAVTGASKHPPFFNKVFETIFLEVARTYQSQGFIKFSILGCTGCLASVYSTSWGIRFIWRQDKLLILQNGIYLGLSAVEHISQSSGIYSRIPANTPDNFNLF